MGEQSRGRLALGPKPESLASPSQSVFSFPPFLLACFLWPPKPSLTPHQSTDRSLAWAPLPQLSSQARRHRHRARSLRHMAFQARQVSLSPPSFWTGPGRKEVAMRPALSQVRTGGYMDVLFPVCLSVVSPENQACFKVSCTREWPSCDP